MLISPSRRKPILFGNFLAEPAFAPFNQRAVDLDAFLRAVNARFPDEKGDILLMDRDCGSTYLLEAAVHAGQMELARALATLVDADGNNLMMLSAQYLQKIPVRSLFPLCDWRTRNHAGLCALELAARRGEHSIVQVLLESGAQDEPGPSGKTALMRAVDMEARDAVHVLLAHSSRAAVQLADAAGDSALIMAVRVCDLEIVEELLPLSQPGWRNFRGEDALRISVRQAQASLSTIDFVSALETCRLLAPSGYHGRLIDLGFDTVDGDRTLFALAAQTATPQFLPVLEALAPYARADDLRDFFQRLIPEQQRLLSPENTPILYAFQERDAIALALRPFSLPTAARLPQAPASPAPPQDVEGLPRKDGEALPPQDPAPAATGCGAPDEGMLEGVVDSSAGSRPKAAHKRRL